jgi:hypothetical protein
MESSKTDMGFTKVCARWVPKQLTGEHKGNILTSCPGLLNCYREEGDAFSGALPLGMKHGSTITLQKANATPWNGNIRHCQSKGAQNSTIGGKSDVGTLLGCTGDNFGTLPRKQHSSKQCPLHWNVLGPVETISKMPRAVIERDTMLHENVRLHTAAHITES